MDIQEIIKQKFTSSNSIPVDSIRITRKEYGQLITSVKEECIELIQIEKMDGLTDETEKDCEQTRIWNGAIEESIKAIRDSK